MKYGEKIIQHLTPEQKEIVMAWVKKHPNLSIPRQVEVWEREWNVSRKALEDSTLKAIY